MRGEGGGVAHHRIKSTGATSEEQFLGVGATTGISFKFEYIGDFEFIFETALGYESGGLGAYFEVKNIRMRKILCQRPCKTLVLKGASRR